MYLDIGFNINLINEKNNTCDVTEQTIHALRGPCHCGRTENWIMTFMELTADFPNGIEVSTVLTRYNFSPSKGWDVSMKMANIIQCVRFVLINNNRLNIRLKIIIVTPKSNGDNIKILWRRNYFWWTVPIFYNL